VFLTPYQAQLEHMHIASKSPNIVDQSYNLSYWMSFSFLHILQRISPWAFPLLLQSVVFDFLSNTAGGAVAYTLIILNAFGDFSPKGLLDMVLKPLY